MKVIPIYAEAGISGFESPAAEYKELGLSLDQLIIKHPNATFIVRHLLSLHYGQKHLNPCGLGI
jgi:hypothetical protein